MEGSGSSNWRPPSQGDPTMNVPEGVGSNNEWRAQLAPEARHRIVSKIMDTLKRHFPISAPEGLGELNKIAVRFEEKIYNAATSQADYLRRISMKMLTMEQKNPSAGGPNAGSLNSNIASQNSPDAALEIETEAKFQNDFLSKLQMTVIKAQAGLKNNMRRMNRSIIQQGSNHVLHVVLFALLCFFLVYLWTKLARR